MNRDPQLGDETMTAKDFEDLVDQLGEWVDCLETETSEVISLHQSRQDPDTATLIREASEAVNTAYDHMHRALACLEGVDA